LSEIARILSRKNTFHVLKTNLFSVLLKMVVKARPAINHKVPVSINGGKGRKN
jgi:MoaA/NifB/PqqE/SkfB family radical SAM enzyme